MKKVVRWLILIIGFWFLGISYMVNNDENYSDSLIAKLQNDNITYINPYGDWYIVLDKENLYLYDQKYTEIIKISNDNLCQNTNNYEIIYRNESFQYLKDYYQSDKLVYEYYHIYTCELIEKNVLGGL